MRIEQRNRCGVRSGFTLLAFLAFIFTFARRVESADKDVRLKTSMSLQDPVIFEKYSFSFGVVRNYPASFSDSNFTQGVWHPIVTFRYFLSDQWYMGFSGHYKFLLEKESQSDLAIATLSQELSYVYRLYHPVYLTLGERVHYLNPTRRAMLPMQKHPSYSVEVGASVCFGLLYQFQNKHIGELVFSRWRGTKTMKLHGYEFQMLYGYKL